LPTHYENNDDGDYDCTKFHQRPQDSDVIMTTVLLRDSRMAAVTGCLELLFAGLFYRRWNKSMPAVNLQPDQWSNRWI